ncbi:palmitoyl-protein thioesterase 1 [Agrilus planipennis]|uniref:Palmitoyl-protein thioesterase 1 n=1 Tax=Agrilus planipennis TaxID=224129 RepID=A0A1W4XJH9_AGRPL|nr:palmitoyl-protein thioesterase 1 [Agrilus planipennis]
MRERICTVSKVLIVLCTFNCCLSDEYTPIVLWHGMGDACCFPYSLGKVQVRLNESLPGVHVVSLRIGSSVIDDLENSYFMHPNKQIEEACSIIQSDPKLAKGYNAIGFSQGSQFLRGLIQRCPYPKAKTYISLGGQHQGVYGLPRCISLSIKTCDYIRRLLNYAAYNSWLQDFLVQATYWHDPLNEEEYREKNSFLSDINNEKSLNQTYIERLRNLENFVMVKFLKDTMVQPIESEWFGFYKPGQSKDIQSLFNSTLYTEDRLGLKYLYENQRMHFISINSDHLRFNWTWFESNIINPFLK